jgi:hypothetical protein
LEPLILDCDEDGAVVDDRRAEIVVGATETKYRHRR